MFPPPATSHRRNSSVTSPSSATTIVGSSGSDGRQHHPVVADDQTDPTERLSANGLRDEADPSAGRAAGAADRCRRSRPRPVARRPGLRRRPARSGRIVVAGDLVGTTAGHLRLGRPSTVPAAERPSLRPPDGGGFDRLDRRPGRRSLRSPTTAGRDPASFADRPSVQPSARATTATAEAMTTTRRSVAVSRRSGRRRPADVAGPGERRVRRQRRTSARPRRDPARPTLPLRSVSTIGGDHRESARRRRTRIVKAFAVHPTPRRTAPTPRRPVEPAQPTPLEPEETLIVAPSHRRHVDRSRRSR